MTQHRCGYYFSLNDRELPDFEKARLHYPIIDIVRLGIKEALKNNKMKVSKGKMEARASEEYERQKEEGEV
jgi:hypothetical protein